MREEIAIPNAEPTQGICLGFGMHCNSMYIDDLLSLPLV